MTKKYFVAYSDSKRSKGKEFVVPIRVRGELQYVGVKKGNREEKFLTVFTGVELTPQMVFQKVVEAGVKVESVDQTLADCEEFLRQAKESKIGFIYLPNDHGGDFEFICEGRAIVS